MSHSVKGSVLGSPIEHSLSPLLHREAFDFLQVEGSYERNEVPFGTLAEFFSHARDSYDYFSITMPLKEEALELDVVIDPLALRIQSANTLYKCDGIWNLTSTDGTGAVAALSNAGHQSFANALILGAGGTARAVVGALDGISKKITVMGRTSTRREALEGAIAQSEFEYIRWSDLINFSDFDLVVNTTPAGAADLLAESLPQLQGKLFFDVIYKPWPTVLGSRWRDCGGEVINGIELLLYQGIEQISLVLNREIDHLGLATHLRPILNKAIR